MVIKRRRYKNDANLDTRLKEQVALLQAQADGLAPGIAREALLNNIEGIGYAIRMNAWLTSPGLKKPE